MRIIRDGLKRKHSIIKEWWKHREERILARRWSWWEKSLVVIALTLSLVTSSSGLFQSLGMIVRFYYQIELSTFRYFGILLITSGIFVFAGWAIVSARLLSSFLADLIFKQI